MGSSYFRTVSFAVVMNLVMMMIMMMFQCITNDLTTWCFWIRILYIIIII